MLSVALSGVPQLLRAPVLLAGMVSVRRILNTKSAGAGGRGRGRRRAWARAWARAGARAPTDAHG